MHANLPVQWVRRRLVRKSIRRSSSSVKDGGSGCTSAEGSGKACTAGDEGAAGFGHSIFAASPQLLCSFSAGSGPLIMGGLEHQGSSESLSGAGLTSPRLSDVTVTDETAAAPTAYTTMDVAVKEAAAAAARRNPSGSTVRTVKFAPSVPSSASTAVSKATYMTAAGDIRAPAPGGGEQATLEVEERSSCPAAARSRPPATGASTVVPFLLSKAATDASGAARRRRGGKQQQKGGGAGLERRQSCPAPSWDPMLEVARVAGRVQSSEIGGGERLELLEVCEPGCESGCEPGYEPSVWRDECRAARSAAESG